jgi:cytochrome c556
MNYLRHRALINRGKYSNIPAKSRTYLPGWQRFSSGGNLQLHSGWSAPKVLAVWLLALLSLGYLQSAHADDQDAIDYRELIMKQLDAEAAALGMIVSGQVPPDSLSLQAKAIANSAKSALKAFEPNVPGGEAKPEVWTKWDDFSKRMQAFAQKSEQMAKVSESGNVQAVTELMIDALPCKSCHDVYRKKK